MDIYSRGAFNKGVEFLDQKFATKILEDMSAPVFEIRIDILTIQSAVV